MKKDRRFKIDRRLLIAAAVIYSILMILGSQYIFVEGTGRLTEYSGIEKIRHDFKDSGKQRHWYIIASKKDGEEFHLVELPYVHTQKNYDEYVRPMLDEIGVIDPGIVIEGPGEFH